MIHATGQVPVAITLKKKKEVVKIIMLQASDLERKIGSKMGQNVKLNHWFIISCPQESKLQFAIEKRNHACTSLVYEACNYSGVTCIKCGI